ncbi:type IV-A pilus assembly ATPase PilB [Nitrospira defluvii]|nr:type IV-A pilus assembly ATPase PilB [Nitrospira defluvii]
MYGALSLITDRLGKMLVEGKLVSEENLQKALRIQSKNGGRLGSILVRLGFIEEENLLTILSRQHGVPTFDLSDITIEPDILKLISVESVKKYLILPIKRQGATLSLVMGDPTDMFAIDDVKFMTGYNIETLIASESSIIATIRRLYDGVDADTSTQEQNFSIEAKDYTLSDTEDPTLFEEGEEQVISVEDFDTVVGDALDNVDVVEEQADEGGIGEVEAPIVKLVNGILVNAIKLGVSDIHVEPFETVFRIRFRIDGVMRTIMNLPTKIKNAVVSRLKIMSKLDIAERRLPQDGRIKLKLGKKREVDFRVSTLPCLFGEKVVMRILDKGNLTLDLTKLGFEERPLSEFQKAIHSPYGMVLVTGPTGSGKTTTLYSALSTINTQEINIMTAEDPVEYNLLGINQVQMKDEIGLNFSAALRSFLRQDPDVVMVGEIRDYETAEIGIKAALTGHLVLSTLHTNDAPSTINRLLNMGIEPFLIASSVILILAQRLVRRICTKCKEVESSEPEALIKAGFKKEDLKGLVVYKGKGCDHCTQTGYKGRVALYEVMPVKDNIRQLVLQGSTSDEIKAKVVAAGMKTLRVSGLDKVKEGVTTIDEILENTVSDIR